MRRCLVVLLALIVAGAPGAKLAAQQPQSAAAPVSAVAAAKMSWSAAQDYLVRSAEQMPESLYNFKPTPQVRSFGQIIAHVAGSQFSYCAMALGEKPRAEEEIEATATTKSAIVAAIKESGTYCQRAYSISDAAASAPLRLYGQNTSKLGALIENQGHTMEHYGNLITYFRLKGMVPPSSQGGM